MNLPSLTLPDPFTVCFYLYHTTLPGGGSAGPAAFQFGLTGGTPADWVTFYDNGYGETYYRLRAQTGGSFIGDVRTADNTLSATSWKHFCVSWNSQRGSIWINGAVVSNSVTPYGGTLQNRAILQYAGNYLGATRMGPVVANYLNGNLDELMIFNRASRI